MMLVATLQVREKKMKTQSDSHYTDIISGKRYTERELADIKKTPQKIEEKETDEERE